MDKAAILSGDVVLLTDGEGLGAESVQSVAALAERGVRVSVVASADPSAQAQTHTSVEGGEVFTLDRTDDLGRWLSDDAATRFELADYPVLLWHDLGWYLLFLALVPMVLLLWREGA